MSVHDDPKQVFTMIRITHESPHATFITAGVYSKLPERLKYNGPEESQIWERRTFKWRSEDLYIYRSEWTEAP
jgi:hypothetical protein